MGCLGHFFVPCPSTVHITLLTSLRKSLLTICKALLRPHIGYGDVILDETFNESFCKKLESVQYKATLEFQIEREGGTTGETSKFRPK